MRWYKLNVRPYGMTSIDRNKCIVCLALIFTFLTTSTFPISGQGENLGTLSMPEKGSLHIRINEVYPDPDTDTNGDGDVDQLDEFVELYNPSSVDVNISGWTISDNGGSYTIGSGSVSAGGFFLIWREVSGLRLGSSDHIDLTASNSTSMDILSWVQIERGRSMQRSPDGAERTRSVKDHTPGWENLPPPRIIMNEVMVDPEGANTGAQWIELFNPGHSEDLEGYCIDNGDGAFMLLPEVRIPSEERCLVFTGEPPPGAVEMGIPFCVISLGRAFYVNGDDLCLTDPDGYLLDYVAWGNSTHVGYPSGIFHGEPWDGGYYDNEMERFVQGENMNPKPHEGRSLKRSEDAFDTNSTLDWKVDEGGMGSTMGYDNSLDPSVLVSLPSDVICVDGRVWSTVNFSMTNTGNMHDELTIDLETTSTSWIIEPSNITIPDQYPGKVVNSSFSVLGPELGDNRSCLVEMNMVWSSLSFIEIKQSVQVMIPGPDLGISDLQVEVKNGDLMSIPEGSFVDISFIAEGGGEINPGNTTVIVEMRNIDTGSISTIFNRQLSDMRTGSRRKMDLRLDTIDLSGNHTLYFSIDPDNLIKEVDENNNHEVVDIRIEPSTVPQGQESLKITKVLWNCTQESTFVEIRNPCPTGIPIDGMKLSDGTVFASFEDDVTIEPGERIYLLWGAKAQERVPEQGRHIWVSGGSARQERMIAENGVPDPFSTGRIQLLSRYRHLIDDVPLRPPLDKGEETTWGTIYHRRVDSRGMPVDTNTSSDWYVYKNSAWIGGILPAPSPSGGPGELIILRTDREGVDVSGLALFLGNRCAVIPNGTRTDENGLLVISSDPVFFRDAQGRDPDLVTGHDTDGPDGDIIPGCRVPSFSEMLLPNSGGNLVLKDRSNIPIDRVSWGSVTEPHLEKAERDVLYWKDNESSDWRILAYGKEKIYALDHAREAENVSIHFFDDRLDLMRWMMQEERLTLHTDLLADDDIYSLLCLYMDEGNEVVINYHVPPWEELDERWGLYANSSSMASIAWGLWKKGADVRYQDGDCSIGGMSIAFARTRMALFPGPFLESEQVKVEPLAGIDLQGRSIDEGHIQEIASSLDLDDAESHLDLLDPVPIDISPLDLGPPGEGSFIRECSMMANDWLGPMDHLKGHMSMVLGEGPWDMVDILDVLRWEDGGRIVLNPRDMSVVSRDCIPFLKEVRSRTEKGEHLYWMDGLKDDMFLRAASIQEVLEGESSNSGMYMGDTTWAYTLFGGYGTSDSSSSIWIPSFGEDRIGTRLDLDMGLNGPLGDLFGMTTPFPWSLIAPETNSSSVGARHQLRIEEVYYNTYLVDDPDEYVAVKNTGHSELDLSGYILSDDEGLGIASDGMVVIENSTVGPGELFFISMNAGAFLGQNGFPPDSSWDRSGSSICTSGFFRLSNSKDTVCLRDPLGSVVDVVAYGSAIWKEGQWSHYGPRDWTGPAVDDVGWGRVLHRCPGPQGQQAEDTDSALDWSDIRDRYPGQSRLTPFSERTMDRLEYGVCPDSSSSIMDDLISGAGSTLLVNVYELTSHWIVSRMIGAVDRGVDVRIILEGNPVGGIRQLEKRSVARLLDKGIDVRLMYTDPSRNIRDRYRYDHAKYIVADGNKVLVSTDNFKDSSFPPLDTASGATTRGWVVSMESKGLANDLTVVFEQDFHGPDMLDARTLIEEWGDIREMANIERSGRHVDIFRPGKAKAGSSARVMVSPDHISLRSNSLMKAIELAEKEIALELLDMDPFYLDDKWDPDTFTGELSNPYMIALLDAAERGVDIRVLLDGTDFDGDLEPDNQFAADILMEAAETRGVSEHLQVQLNPRTRFHDRGNIELIHAKGAIIDSDTTWISSYNWNPVSGTENREVGVLISSRECAGYFRGVFDFDWDGTLQDEVEARKVWAYSQELEDGGWEVVCEFDITCSADAPTEFLLYARSGKDLPMQPIGSSGPIHNSTSVICIKGTLENITEVIDLRLHARKDSRELEILEFDVPLGINEDTFVLKGLLGSPLIPLAIILLISLGTALMRDVVRAVRNKKRNNAGIEE
ncbi:MAG: lamin tail domain-containing protein [Thermoplasmatota archaeon]